MGDRDSYDIKVEINYTTDESLFKVDKGELRVEGAIVVIDNLTNVVRGTYRRPAASPKEMVMSVDRLRKALYSAGAVSVITCQVKPMQTVDVTPHNQLLDEYLRAQTDGGLGCRTQIRTVDLDSKGFHVKPECVSIIDRTYACALLGVRVPCPTEPEDFIPDFVKQRWEKDWPRLGRMSMGGKSPSLNHGW